jgi:hypothetical protein
MRFFVPIGDERFMVYEKVTEPRRPCPTCGTPGPLRVVENTLTVYRGERDRPESWEQVHREDGPDWVSWEQAQRRAREFAGEGGKR